jgi:uncharacterized membrane protein YjgN (DUF898 family)
MRFQHRRRARIVADEVGQAAFGERRRRLSHGPSLDMPRARGYDGDHTSLAYHSGTVTDPEQAPGEAEAPETPPPLHRAPSAQPAAPAAPAVPAAPPALDDHPAHPFEFTGTGREYFRIWIVNLFLSVITLGVYSAWAKVRRLQYFHRNTRVAGFGFDYHADPVAILKGRLIAAAGLAIYFLAGLWGPVAGLVSAGVLMLCMPWVLARSLRFRLHNTSYRGVRFRFSGSVRSAYWVFLGLPLLSLLSLFTLVPFAQHRGKRYQYANAALGRTPLTFAAPVGEFYITAIAAAFASGMVVFLGFLALVAGLVASRVASGEVGAVESDAMPGGFLPGLFVVYALGIVLGQAINTSRIQNVIWAHVRLGTHRFACRLKAGRLFLILFSNLALTILTLGIYRSFAQVRLASYLAGAMTVVPSGSLDDFTTGDEGAVGAAGEEAAELFDFDIGF